MVVWKIGGEAGYGILSTGSMFSQIMLNNGHEVFSITEYPSLIRGGHNTFAVRFDKEKISSLSESVDVLAALDELTIGMDAKDLLIGGALIYDESIDISKKSIRKDIKKIALPLNEMAKNYADLSKVIVATIAVGASAKLMGLNIDIIKDLIAKRFSKKDKKIVAQNIEALMKGYDSVKSQIMQIAPLKKNPKKLLIDGNTAIAIGAIRAGLKFMSSYPMTPATSIMQYIATHQEKHNLLMHQAEDEISALNYALGASYAGVRSMVATSGGGFALMNETLSLAGSSEMPIVIVLGQRPGPATGLPTRTEQGDLLFSIHAGHGEFPKIVLAPGDADESYDLTLEAFNLADKYQTPAIILTDHYLANSLFTINEFNDNYKINRGKLITEVSKKLKLNEKFKRYEITADGVSPRTIPGTANGMQCSIGDEHDEEGYIVEEAADRKAMMDKRAIKIAGIKKELNGKSVKVYGNPVSSKVILSWGSTKGIILETLKELKNYKFVQVLAMNPFPSKELEEKIGKYDELIVIEQNMTSQLGALTKQHTNLNISRVILKYDGRAFNPEDIISHLGGRK
jgi:2-oxoglutarate ferredoxin oxidoreductase subunit alpha